MFQPISIADAASQIRSGRLAPSELLEQCLEQHPGIRLSAIDSMRQDGARIVVIELAAPQPLSADLARDLAMKIADTVFGRTLAQVP